MTPRFFAAPALAASLVAFAFAGSARAFCQTNSCDPARGEDCSLDENGCTIGGVPLAWTSNCVTFSVQQDGSELNGITARAFERSIESSFETWMKADCGEGAFPSINVVSIGEVECHAVEYNKKGNSNIYMFQDGEWMEVSIDALALTTVWYDYKTGEMFDVDVEVNGSQGDITNTAPEDGADLLSIITHESGHFLGLAHSPFSSDATMRSGYTPMIDNLRALAQDDIDGICAVYPPERQPTTTDCNPRHGFSGSCFKETSGCECSAAPGRPSPGAAWLLLGVAGLGALSRRRGRK